MIRKAIGLRTHSLSIKQHVSNNVMYIDIVLTLTAGIKGEDRRILDWTKVPKKDAIFGEIEGVYRVMALSPFSLLLTLQQGNLVFIQHLKWQAQETKRISNFFQGRL